MYNFNTRYNGCDVIGYCYEAAMHCLECSSKRFPNANTEFTNVQDSEGNTPSPVFMEHEPGEYGDWCDDCHEPLDNTDPSDYETAGEKTVVVFRKFKQGGDIIALFPELVNYPNGNCESYQHIGQHGAADYSHCISISNPATPDEYAPLKRELERIGYVLDIKKRFVRK